MALHTFIGLLRGVNVGGRNRMPMAELRSLCADMGWQSVQTYIQSGNLVFRAPGSAPMLEGQLEDGIERHFGLSIPVIVRAVANWTAHVDGNPFPDASRTAPSLVMLGLSKAPPNRGAVEGLLERAAGGEQVVRVGEALWIYYAGGAGRSRISPALLDRLAGSPVTTRNWRTVLELSALAARV